MDVDSFIDSFNPVGYGTDRPSGTGEVRSARSGDPRQENKSSVA
jgi:hypothetical protein